MKVILSRKGFDSSNGGIVSPIFPDGTPVSFPIPSFDYDAYCDFQQNGINYFQILQDLGYKGPCWHCHTDPDLDESRRINRAEGWVPAFGQIGPPAGYLKNLGIEKGDLFLFFGNFHFVRKNNGHVAYETNTGDFYKDHDIQMIWGYLQIGDILDTPEKQQELWWHPHSGIDTEDSTNVIFTAAENLSLDPEKPGAGLLPYHEKRVLTLRGQNKATWKKNSVYDVDHIIGNRRNSAKDPENGIYYSGIWQELGLEESDACLEWATDTDNLVASTLEAIVKMNGVKKTRVKEYKSFINELAVGTPQQKQLKAFQIMLEITNDFKKDNSLNDAGKDMEFTSSDGIDWRTITTEIKELYERLEENNGKKIIRRVQDLSQRASQLHEKINYLKVQSDLAEMGDDWKERKAYVDNLYQGMDKRNKVKQSYMANYTLPEEDFHWNVAFLNGRQYEGEVDLFVGGSPCQSFSFVGKQRGLDDTRGTLFYEYARLIDEIKPKVFIYENVRAVLSNDGGKTWRKMQQVFEELDYDFSWKVLNARDYGIPQNRERLFVVGFRKDLSLAKAFAFPESIPLEKKMKDFLLDNAPGGYFLPEKGVEFVTREKNLTKKFTQIDGDVQLCQKKNQQFNWHGDFVFQSEQEAEENNIPDLEKYYLSEKVRKYVLATGTKNFYSKPEIDLDVARPLLTTMHKMHRAGVDNYVTTDGRLRKLTPRECLRLMGFSDSFRIIVSDTSMYQQAGNSIVVDVLIHIMESIIDSYPEIV